MFRRTFHSYHVATASMSGTAAQHSISIAVDPHFGENRNKTNCLGDTVASLVRIARHVSSAAVAWRP